MCGGDRGNRLTWLEVKDGVHSHRLGPTSSSRSEIDPMPPNIISPHTLPSPLTLKAASTFSSVAAASEELRERASGGRLCVC